MRTVFSETLNDGSFPSCDTSSCVCKCVCAPVCECTWGLEMFKLTREWNVAVVSSAEVPELAELQATPEL